MKTIKHTHGSPRLSNFFNDMRADKTGSAGYQVVHNLIVVNNSVSGLEYVFLSYWRTPVSSQLAQYLLVLDRALLSSWIPCPGTG